MAHPELGQSCRHSAAFGRDPAAAPTGLIEQDLSGAQELERSLRRAVEACLRWAVSDPLGPPAAFAEVWR